MSRETVNDDLRFVWRPGKNGNGILSVRVNGNPHPILTRKLDSTKGPEQRAFLDELYEKAPDVDRDLAEAKMELVAAEAVGDADMEEKLSQGQNLTKLAASAELFHCGETAYSTINVTDSDGHEHAQTYPLNAPQFHRWLDAQFFKTYGRPATAAARQDAINALSGKAIFERPEKPVAVRLAEHGGAIYLDLADDAWRAVRITSGGWSLVNDPPVKFMRKKGMMALPTPIRGGNINRLRPLLNADDERNWTLMLSWLLGAFHPHGPYTVLCIMGEHGSAKSTTSKMLRMLIDPNRTVLRSPPREERDLMIQASNGWVMAFDNISGMPQWLSDALCRLATGGGFSTRMLTTDDTEILFDAKRPIILNGIEEDASKEDLLDRAIRVSLPAIRKRERLPEDQIWAAFELMAPEVLGGLLDAVSQSLAHAAAVQMDELPRMADFAKWVVAGETKLGLEAGTFMQAYGGNRDDADEDVIEQSLIGPAVLTLMDRCPMGVWTGTTAELLEAIEHHATERAKRSKFWPNTVSKLAAKLRRLAPVLRSRGIEIQREREGRNRREVRIMCGVCETSAASAASAATVDHKGLTVTVSEKMNAPQAPQAPQENGVFEQKTGERDSCPNRGASVTVSDTPQTVTATSESAERCDSGDSRGALLHSSPHFSQANSQTQDRNSPPSTPPTQRSADR